MTLQTASSEQPAASKKGVNATNQQMSEEDFTSLFEAAMQRSQENSNATNPSNEKNIQITPDEQQKFVKAMGDPAFRSLLQDYMQEISDPAHREETEQYLSQLEKEDKLPEGRELLTPIPGFVLKANFDSRKQGGRKETSKLFINVCSHAKIQPPSSTTVSGSQSNPHGTSWHLPYSFGPERAEKDHAGQDVPTFDVCFHPRTVDSALGRIDFKDMVAKICLEAAQTSLRQARKQTSLTIVMDSYRVLKGVKYKTGRPVSMCIRTSQSKETTSREAKAKEIDRSLMRHEEVEEKAEVKVDKPIRKVQIEEVDDTPIVHKDTSKKTFMYRVVHRGNFNLLNHTNSRNVDADRPKELVVDIECPDRMSAAGLQLDVSDKCIKLNDTKGVYESLEVQLPYVVVEAKGSARFDKQKQQLKVTLPVQPPVQEERRMEMPIEEVESEEEDTSVTSESKLEEEDSLEASEDKWEVVDKVSPPKKMEEKEDEFKYLKETMGMVQEDTLYHTKAKEKKQVTWTTPTYILQETDSCLSYIIDVASIQKDTVHITSTSNGFDLEFKAGESNAPYHLTVDNMSTSVASDPKVDVATENMVVIYTKRSHPSSTPNVPDPLSFQNELVYELD